MTGATAKQYGKWLGLLLLIGGAVNLQAEQRIATIDLKEVFDNYYKTKVADARLKERGAEFEKTLKGMYQDYKQAQKEYQKLIEGANNQALSSTERERRKKAAEQKLQSIRQLEKEVQQYDRTAKTTLQEQQERMRKNIMEEVREVVSEEARAEGYTLVIDTAAMSVNQTPIVVFSGDNEEDDLSQPVLSRLNADAPDDLPEVEDGGDRESGPLPGSGLPDLDVPGRP